MLYFVLSAAAVMMLIMFINAAIITAVNFGNVTGAVLSLALLFFCIFHKKIYVSVHELVQGRAGKIIVTVVCTACVVCVIAVSVISAKMILQAQNSPPNGIDTVIVLGCRVKPEGPSTMLRTRTYAACEYLKANPDAVCIASGGKGSDEPCSEAQAIHDILIGQGIPEERIIMEDHSTTTAENFAFSRILMEKRGLGGKAVIATSEFHQYRASIIARKNGIEECYSVNSHTLRSLIASYWIREWYAVVYEVIINK